MRIGSLRSVCECCGIEAALDATQETFVTVFRKADRFAGRSAFGTWLYRVAVNTCYDHAGSRGAIWRNHSRRGTTRWTPPPATPSARSSCVPTWRPPWRHSPAEFRAAVVLADVEGLGLQTVAEALGVPVGTVKSRVFRDADFSPKHSGT